jgi:hypothetical protein
METRLSSFEFSLEVRFLDKSCPHRLSLSLSQHGMFKWDVVCVCVRKLIMDVIGLSHFGVDGKHDVEDDFCCET